MGVLPSSFYSFLLLLFYFLFFLFPWNKNWCGALFIIKYHNADMSSVQDYLLIDCYWWLYFITAMISALQKSESDQTSRQECKKLLERLGKVSNEAEIRLSIENMVQKNEAYMYAIFSIPVMYIFCFHCFSQYLINIFIGLRRMGNRKSSSWKEINLKLTRRIKNLIRNSRRKSCKS